ncbi:MAG: HAMP domain-containing histidine kinase [Gemmatimonadales bacterium]|nr:HAMP domain-containing histidine kinase [Gemmatimonadales bacterium]
MRHPSFRTRLFLILALFAFVPSIVLTLAWSGLAAGVAPLVSGSGAWEQVAASGERAIRLSRSEPGSEAALAALERHEAELGESRLQARRFAFLADRAAPMIAVAGLVALALITLLASRVAGHLSRQLSRPVDELVGWTGRLARGEPLPPAEEQHGRGAPEFGMLRSGMREMSAELERGRLAALEAERLAAFRESARQVAHELKNPLTPIRFAVASLRRTATAEQRETVEVLDTESARLEAMARSFAQFGRLPEGPSSAVDLAELARETVRTAVPPGVEVRVESEGVTLVSGQHDALQRALTNVVLNAVDATSGRGRIVVRAAAEPGGGVLLAVRDDGIGIPAERLARIWDPYVTAKTGGTGLGLAIVKQTVRAHGGSVSAASEPGKGTEIRMHFPANAVTTPSPGGDA